MITDVTVFKKLNQGHNTWFTFERSATKVLDSFISTVLFLCLHLVFQIHTKIIPVNRGTPGNISHFLCIPSGVNLYKEAGKLNVTSAVDAFLIHSNRHLFSE